MTTKEKDWFIARAILFGVSFLIFAMNLVHPTNTLLYSGYVLLGLGWGSYWLEKKGK